MTGMKQGAGENPFAEDSDTDKEQSPTVDDKPDSETQLMDVDTENPGIVRSEGTTRSESGDSSQPMQIPYKFRRDGVQDGRNRVPLFLHSDTKSAERDALREFEEQFDSNVSLTDLREALVMTGLDHLDEVKTQLEDWGYGMTFDD
ncbi:hypothetical protein HAPAU_34110 [Halalkalicoccus paucihalophilus]|uniref:Uncharacterized protein n=1 Tax=Halalkalicoccus paucihalophilus TaxID=1008153 RepID=A0A151A9P5_9EURY|nr:hypothetical protein [Halalkalicoccus paucihalophilus]KYH24428.1 hypothetical protein HAPAU_34110 [Halalkalicoccus paucihalophilus]